MKKGELTRVFDARTEILASLLGEKKHIYQPIDELNLSPGIVNKNVTLLEEDDSTGMETEDEFPGRSFVSLTEKGKEIARHLEEVRRILKGS